MTLSPILALVLFCPCSFIYLLFFFYFQFEHLSQPIEIAESWCSVHVNKIHLVQPMTSASAILIIVDFYFHSLNCLYRMRVQVV